MSIPAYTIVVPSRRRPHNMETIRWLLPTAMICIDEREVDDYLQFVERSKLLIHPPMDGLPFVINWAMEAVKTPVLIFIDDDLCGVQVNLGSKRFITDAEEILAIIENAIICANDLKITSFCWSRTMNATVIDPARRPIVPTQSVSTAFGVMGAARHRKYDTTLLARASVDWTLRTLLEDRWVYADIRYYFDCGQMFSGRGGNVGIVTPESLKETTRLLAKRWGNSLRFKAASFQKNRDVTAMRIAVNRSNKSAQR